VADVEIVIRRHTTIRLGDLKIKGARLVVFAIIASRKTGLIQVGNRKLWLWPLPRFGERSWKLPAPLPASCTAGHRTAACTWPSR
jgi:hypothetical protein